MLQLPNVTLIAMTGKDVLLHEDAIDESCKGIAFGDVKLIEDKTINTIDEWNKRIVYDLWKYVTTDFAILIHADGCIKNPKAWRDEFLDYDYVGAPWPLPQDDFSYRDKDGNIIRVGNSVSLRSKRLMKLPSQLKMEWKPYYGFTNEDGFICCHNRHLFEEKGMKFAPLNVAKYFSKEHEIPENKGLETFAFHSTL